VVLPLCVASLPAAAQRPPQARELRGDPALDATVTVGGVAAWVVTEILKGNLAPSRCRWCKVDPVDAGARDALLWRDKSSAGTLSDITAFILAPVAAVGLDALAAAHEGALRHVPQDALLVAEAAVVATDINQLAKMLFGRERPFVHALQPEQKALTVGPADNDLSFFSGHSTEAFAMAAASGTIATMRGYRWAPLAWGVGGVVAATTAYLRVAADKHWLTDVVVGMLVGTGIGFAVPYFFHSAAGDSPPATASAALRAPAPPAGTVVTFAW
jgi:membrane-associated phospholipid phosphatase